jgi:hypothetical protein
VIGSITGTLDTGSRLFIGASVVVNSDLTSGQSGRIGDAELSFWVTTPGDFIIPYSNIQLWNGESYLYDFLTATSIVNASLELELFGMGTVDNDPGSGVLTPLAVSPVPEPSSVVVAGQIGGCLIGGLAARRLARPRGVERAFSDPDGVADRNFPDARGAGACARVRPTRHHLRPLFRRPGRRAHQHLDTAHPRTA